MGNPASVLRKKSEKRRKKYELRLGPGVYLPKEDRLRVNAEVVELSKAIEQAKAEKKAAAKAPPAEKA